MRCIAYVLISADPGVTRQVFELLGGVDSVIDRFEVTGPYDIVLKLGAPNLSDFPALVGEQIRTIPGVASTTTLVAFPRADLRPVEPAPMRPYLQ